MKTNIALFNTIVSALNMHAIVTAVITDATSKNFNAMGKIFLKCFNACPSYS